MIDEIVSAGSYSIASGKAGSMEAHLGTCVGVALCDRGAGVGGMIHLVLPSPEIPENPWQPEIYASTGLPLFIKKLCESGARKEKLEASVAGGGLIGPLTERDLTLDLGGRTAHVVESILIEEGIPVKKSEIGGYFGCRLKLDLKTWEADIKLFGVPSGKVPETGGPNAEDLEKSIARVFPIPQIALKVIRMILDPNSGLREIANEIGRDQVLSARILRYCNTPVMSKGREIDSVERAVMVLGNRTVLQIAMAISIQDFFATAEGGYSLCKGGMFKHSVGTGVVCRTLAEFTGKTSGNLAYTAGLLHDLGKVVLDQHVVKWYPLFYQRVREEPKGLSVVERDLFGLSHTEAGGLLARQWSLPERLVEVIERHHCPEEASLDAPLTCLVHVADGIMSRFRTGFEIERFESSSMDFSLSRIGLSREGLHSAIADICVKLFGNQDSVA